jgi:hypothetical protein
MVQRIPFQWNTANFNWNATNPTDGKIYPPNEIVTGTNLWDDCALIVELINVIKNGGSPEDHFGKDKEKKKKFIKILCKVEGIEYKETKEVLKRQIRITDVALVAKEILKIDIKLNDNV